MKDINNFIGNNSFVISDSWRNRLFKKYNFNAFGIPPTSGHGIILFLLDVNVSVSVHPLLKVRSEFREIFFQMGFAEMPTNREFIRLRFVNCVLGYVESSFWNFDALFQPQQHPARDSHDTFFIAGKTCCFIISKIST